MDNNYRILLAEDEPKLGQIFQEELTHRASILIWLMMVL